MQKKALFEANECLLVCVDIQEKLFSVIQNKGVLLKNSNTLLEASRLFNIKTIVTEQYPKGLGHTHSEIEFCKIDKFEDFNKDDDKIQCLCLEKISFSIFNDDNIAQIIKQISCKKIILFGIESHVCMLQSLIQGLELGYDMYAVEDAMSSRTVQNHENALKFIRQSGVKVINVETFLFGLMVEARGDNFKSISSLVK